MDDWQDPFEEAPEASAAVATNDRASKSKKHDLPYSGFQQASKIRKQEGGAPAAAPAGGGSEAVINQPAASGLVDKQAAEIAALKKMLKEQAAAAAAAAAVKNAPKEEVQREFQLSKTKKVSVREFRGKTLVDIREYYQKDGGEWAPGRKGISLTGEQWEKLKQLVDSIDLAVSNS
jgi:hypothetical protein